MCIYTYVVLGIAIGTYNTSDYSYIIDKKTQLYTCMHICMFNVTILMLKCIIVYFGYITVVVSDELRLMLLLQIDPCPAVDFLLLCSYHRPHIMGVLVRCAGFRYFSY